MSLSKRHLNTHTSPITFSPAELGDMLQKQFPQISFCLISGSAQNGLIDVGSDIDISLYLNTHTPPSSSLYSNIAECVTRLVPSATCDISLLNTADPIFCFNALKGRVLFIRDMEQYSSFFALSCREYEHQMFDYERQLRYRKERCSHAI